MKKAIFLLAIIALFAACTTMTEKQNTYKINVEFSGADEGMLYLATRGDGKWIYLDSADVTGDIVFEGEIEMPEMYYLLLDKRQRSTVFVEPSDITVTTTAEDFYNNTVTGSKAHTEYDAYNESLTVFDERMSPLRDEYRAAREAEDEAKLKEIEEQFDAIYEEQTAAIKQYILDNPNSVVSAYIAQSNNYYFDLEELEQIGNSFPAEIENSTYVQQIKERVAALQRVAIGKSYIDFEMADTNGEMVKLSDMLNKGNYILMDFWASWCGPCRAENPNIVAVYNDYKDKGFDIIGISLDRDKDKWLEGIEEDNLTWTHVSNVAYWDCPVRKDYAVNSIPHSILLDPQGTIVAKNLRGDELREKVAELLD